MTGSDAPGQIVILNGPPRAGKSSIVTEIQNTFDGVWMNLGVDRFKPMAPERFQPGTRPATRRGAAGPRATGRDLVSRDVRGRRGPQPARV